MKSVWRHFAEAIVFFAIFGAIYNILSRTNIVTDPNTQGTLIKVIAIALLVLWTFVNMRINRKTRESQQE